MTRIVVVIAIALLAGGPAAAQFHDGVDDSVAARRAADPGQQRRTPCEGPACRNDAQGIYPQSTAPGQGAATPSMSGGFVQH